MVWKQIVILRIKTSNQNYLKISEPYLAIMANDYCYPNGYQERLSKPRKNYTVHEKETLAFINALEKFRIDLQPVKFIYQTDSLYTKDGV